jgi:hypothetical protein
VLNVRAEAAPASLGDESLVTEKQRAIKRQGVLRFAQDDEVKAGANTTAKSKAKAGATAARRHASACHDNGAAALG